MPKPKGGRGNTAPYESKLARIPLPLADQVSQLVERYQDFIAQGGEAFSPPPLLDAIADYKPVNELSDNTKLVNELRKAIALKDQALEELHLEKAEILLQWGQVIKKRDELEQEVNALHGKNGELNLELEELRSQLVDRDKAVNNLIKPVNNLVHLEVKPVNNLVPLKAVELGRRLGYKDHSYIVRVKSKPDFTDWSRGKDPGGIGWRYDAESKFFFPVD